MSIEETLIKYLYDYNNDLREDLRKMEALTSADIPKDKLYSTIGQVHALNKIIKYVIDLIDKEYRGKKLN